MTVVSRLVAIRFYTFLAPPLDNSSLVTPCCPYPEPHQLPLTLCYCNKFDGQPPRAKNVPKVTKVALCPLEQKGLRAYIFFLGKLAEGGSSVSLSSTMVQALLVLYESGNLWYRLLWLQKYLLPKINPR